MPGYSKQDKPGYRGTVVGVPEKEFDPKGTCKKFNEVLSGGGPGRKELTIIRLVISHNNKQRQIIRSTFQNLYNKDLAKELMKGLSGHLSQVIFSLMLHPEEYLMRQVHKSIRGKYVKAQYTYDGGAPTGRKDFDEIEYGKDMEEDVADDLSGDFRKFLLGLMNATRSEWDGFDADLVSADAQALYEVRLADLGAREELFNTIFNARSPGHLLHVFNAYEKLSRGKCTIEGTINDAFTGSLRKAYLVMVKRSRNLIAYNAERLYKSMHGPGTDDDTLIEIMVSRSEIDLRDISEVYQTRYGKSFMNAMINDTSGHYQTALAYLLDSKYPINK